MPERYPCGQCDLDFNFRIKLNRHVQKVHNTRDNISLEPHFLNTEITLTIEDKLKYFDELKIKFSEVNNKINNYEKRFEYLQSKLRSLEQFRSLPKRKLVKKKFRGSKKATGSYEDIDNDSTIPPGWKSSYKVNDTFDASINLF